jgi:site-specific DNA-methyltransferase (adenine-specific)
MQTIPLTKVKISANRQRQEFDAEALQDLKNSIEDTQLMHPIVLRKDETTGDMILVAGERRLRAITEIFALGGSFVCAGIRFLGVNGIIPFTDMGELSVLQAEEAELDENLKRRDLTWQEHAAAVARLHKLRQEQLLESCENTELKEKEPEYVKSLHTIAHTAEEIHGRSDGSYQDSIRKEIIVAQHLNNPVISKAKNADEAFKLLKREEEQKKNIALAAVVGASFTADSHTLLNVDCLEWMADPANYNQFDVILTDPPYGMGADLFGDGGGKMDGIEHHYSDSYENWLSLMKAWTRLSFLVAKPQAHAYVFCDIDRFHELRSMMQEAGWYVFRTPFVVHKINSGRVPLPDRGPRRQYEILLYAIKGSKPVTHIYPDVIPCSADDNMSHGAQKPVALFENLLMRSVRPGDKVLDCFAGTGPIFPAAHKQLCEATGLELNPEYYTLAMKRLKELKQADSITLME